MMTPEEQMAHVEMAQKYKNVFASLEGQDVLLDIVWNILGTFGTDKTTESDMALSNAGNIILNMVSCSDADLTAKTIVRAALNAPAVTIKKEKQED